MNGAAEPIVNSGVELILML